MESETCLIAQIAFCNAHKKFLFHEKFAQFKLLFIILEVGSESGDQAAEMCEKVIGTYVAELRVWSSIEGNSTVYSSMLCCQQCKRSSCRVIYCQQDGRLQSPNMPFQLKREDL